MKPVLVRVPVRVRTRVRTERARQPSRRPTMTRADWCFLITALWLALAAPVAAQPAKATAQPPPAGQTLTLSCAVVYMPARSTWVREVQIDWDRQKLRALRIDGLVPYGFSLTREGVSTAIDNERIQIDLKQAQWASDYRGLATGQGRCETVKR